MNDLYYNDIIFARATPPGPSAIAVIRVSGKNSWKLLDEIFDYKNKSNYITHHAYHGNIKDGKNIIDNVIIITYSENKSFTGEESFEINCHGSEVIISLIIKSLLNKGIRLSEPGEFSKRAFLNGKIDLTKAESIMDIVHSSTKKSALIAVQQLSGGLSEKINEIKELLSNLLAGIEVDIDYPEEDIDSDMDGWIKKTDEIIDKINFLLSSYKRGKFYREGINAVILGRTNSGKSTLFNLLLNEDKAIVSDIHGTTRDFLDGIINIKGYGVRIYDTAGLRNTDDPIEIEGTKRAIDLSKRSNLVIYVIDSTDNLNDDDKKNLLNIDNNKKLLIIINKIDLINSEKCKKIINDINSLKLNNDYNIITMSALNKKGINDFNNSFIDLIIEDKIDNADDPIMTNERHAFLLKSANENLIRSKNVIIEGLLDLCAFELREALNKIGEITGEVTPEDILNKIFSNFCVGK